MYIRPTKEYIRPTKSVHPTYKKYIRPTKNATSDLQNQLAPCTYLELNHMPVGRIKKLKCGTELQLS